MHSGWKSRGRVWNVFPTTMGRGPYVQRNVKGVHRFCVLSKIFLGVGNPVLSSSSLCKYFSFWTKIESIKKLACLLLTSSEISLRSLPNSRSATYLYIQIQPICPVLFPVATNTIYSLIFVLNLFQVSSFKT